ncbi:MAG: L-rhamnose mutarotase [Planctomycetota bacterium]|nr:L-rhamnose mutarotase [Planctomycetota bacterium]
MAQFAYALDLIDDDAVIAAYEQHHQRIWPEVAKALRDIGITEMHIYRSGARLFMVFQASDAFDPDRDFARYAAMSRIDEWERLMKSYQRASPAAAPGDWWSHMRCVFSLSDQPR